MLLGLLLTITAGCGFKPVYMPTASGKPGPAQRELAAVAVDLLPERPGQLLRQALQERLASDSGSIPALYDLHVAFGISGEGIAVISDSAATRIRLVGSATWSLTPRNPAGPAITSGFARAGDAFNIIGVQYFASDLENEAAQRRLAEAIADQITLQLAVYFRKQAGLSG
ncbi:MAG: hypothetical protein JO227_07200 [Acetobacteraceae bacterium]|nr:hypothetical protein [Acetobacteraceae bacterium]